MLHEGEPSVLASRDAEAALAEGERLLAGREVEAALAAFAAAHRLGAAFDSTAARLWHCAMLLGRFELAWRISDAVLARRRQRGLRCDHQPLHLQWVWDGTALDGRDVVVRCHHGLGDVIQFARLLQPLRRLARRVHLQVPAALLPLFRSFRYLDRLSAMEADANDPDAVAIELLELPHALRLQPAGIPCDVPYLTPPPRLRRTGELRVGVVWAAGAWKPERSVPFAMLAPLGRIPGIRFVCLQRGPALAALEAGPDPLRLRGTGSATDDIMGTVRRLGSVDLVVTVDTMMAHLAGALGLPTWTLLHFDADWRWLARGERSPWYPTMRLFRQGQPGEWGRVIAGIATRLERAAAMHEGVDS